MHLYSSYRLKQIYIYIDIIDVSANKIENYNLTGESNYLI
jgi:hypothetical protein